MQNRSKSWADIQMIISSIAVAATMGFWSLFSSNQKLTAGATGTADLSQPDPNSATANNDMLLPGQVMLLGPTPQTQQVGAAPQAKVWRGGGGSKGGGGGSAPAASSSGGGGGSKTGSSKP